MRILVRAPNWIGDQLMAYPFFYQLRRKYPNARIAVACVPWVADLQFRNLVDDVIVVHPPAGHQLSALARLRVVDEAAREVRRKGPWDLGFALPNSFGTAWFLWRAGCRRRVGYAAEARRWLLTDPVEWGPAAGLHRAQAYIQLIHQGGRGRSFVVPDIRGFWTLPPENDLDPPIRGEVDAFPAELAWPRAAALEPPSEPYWVMAPGSMADSRRWGEEQFVTLAREVVRETGWSGVIVGGPKEAPIAERLKQDRSLHLKDWTARGPITDLWKLLRDAKFTVANDSGIAHLSALLGSPTYVAWGAGDPRRTRPLGPSVVQIEVNPVDCWPCEKNSCERSGGEHLACIRGVKASSVWTQIRRGVLRKPAQHEREFETDVDC